MLFQCRKGIFDRCRRNLELFRSVQSTIATIIGVCPAGHWRELTPLEFEEVFTMAMRGEV